jgi:hypothetical protein
LLRPIPPHTHSAFDVLTMITVAAGYVIKGILLLIVLIVMGVVYEDYSKEYDSNDYYGRDIDLTPLVFTKVICDCSCCLKLVYQCIIYNSISSLLLFFMMIICISDSDLFLRSGCQWKVLSRRRSNKSYFIELREMRNQRRSCYLKDKVAVLVAI